MKVQIIETGDVSKQKIDDFSGNKIGPYLVKDYAGKGFYNESKTPYHLWNVECDCGQVIVLKHTTLKREDKVKCVCDRFTGDYEKYKSIANRHTAIVNKCHHQDAVDESTWANYGGRVNPVTGAPEPIRVAEEWHDKYTFARDIERTIGFPPAKGWILGRIDDTKGFEIGNVQWKRNLGIQISGERFLSLSVNIEPSISLEKRLGYFKRMSEVGGNGVLHPIDDIGVYNQMKLTDLIKILDTVTGLLESQKTQKNPSDGSLRV